MYTDMIIQEKKSR